MKWKYSDGEICDETNPRMCPKCGQLPTEKGHDFCLGDIDDVSSACCGHGVGEDYIQFENGIVIRGYFTIDNKNKE